MPIPRKKAKLRRPRTKKSGAWQVQTAKARFSEVIRQARSKGPQLVTKQGKDEVVILPVEEYRRLTQRDKQPKSLARFFAESPLADSGLNLERTRDHGRTVDL